MKSRPFQLWQLNQHGSNWQVHHDANLSSGDDEGRLDQRSPQSSSAERGGYLSDWRLETPLYSEIKTSISDICRHLQHHHSAVYIYIYMCIIYNSFVALAL